MTLLVAALLAIAGAAAFVYSGIYDVSASSPHSAVAEWAMETTRRHSVERRAGRVEAPDHSDDSLVLAGADDFERMCVQCHGAPDREPGEVGRGLNPPAPDLAESAKEMTSAEVFWVTKNGIKMTGMPAWGSTHDDQSLWPVVALVKRLPEIDAAAYRDLLTRAEGLGHHADGAAEDDHSHAGAERRGNDEHGEANSADESREAEDDSGSHDH